MKRTESDAETTDEWIDASTERRWELLRGALTKHLEFNVFYIIAVVDVASLLGARELAKSIIYVTLGLYFIALILMGFAILLLLLLSSLSDDEDRDGSAK